MTVENQIHITDKLTEPACVVAMETALEKARALNLKLAIAVLDGGGHLLRFVRMEGTHAGTVDVAIAKARCAVMFKRSTKTFAEAYQGGASALLALPGVVPFEGGVPVIVAGEVIGAVGCSGASPDQDGAVASASVDALLSQIG